MAITATFVTAEKVQFLKPICEDDFVEKGMVAWLTDIEWCDDHECYKLYFDFAEFDAINDKYFRASYFANRVTRTAGLEKEWFTAKEAGMYEPKYSVFFSAGNMTTRDDAAFAKEIRKYLVEVE